MKIKEGSVMDIQRKCFEKSNNVNPDDWSFRFDEDFQQYIALDSEMELQVDEFNEHWDTFRAGWRAAKAQAVPEGCVLVEKKLIKTLHEELLDHEPDSFVVNRDICELWKQAND